MMRTEISNSDDVCDSRQIEDRITELEAVEESERDADEGAELATLLALREECENVAGEEWRYGVTLIRDSYFVDYAQELAEDIGAISRDFQWPLYCIDWEHAARELRMDYSSVAWDGVTYWVRS